MSSLNATPEHADTLEPVIAEVEQRLGALAQALLARDSRDVDAAASALQQALAQALDCFGRAAREGGIPPALRQRLVRASGQVAAQRETLARATAALDRALEGLLPREATVYTARGTAALAVHSGSARA
ncbi:MAG TPA: hypothetical protein VNV16_10160 [Methylibium sp.]|nr:hypothetical protein [Methylibium sp.]